MFYPVRPEMKGIPHTPHQKKWMGTVPRLLVYTSPVQKHTFWVLVPYLFIKSMVNSLYKIPTFQNHVPQHVGGTSMASKTHSSLAHQMTPVLSKFTARCKDSMQNSQNRCRCWPCRLPSKGHFLVPLKRGVKKAPKISTCLFVVWNVDVNVAF